MKKISKICLLSLLSVMSLCGCGGTSDTTSASQKTETPATESPATGTSTTEKGSEGPVEDVITPSPKVENIDDDDMYYDILGDFSDLYDEAVEITDADQLNERYVAFAKAEAALLESAVMVPNSTSGGSYTLSRAAYRSTPYVQWGYDADMIKNAVVATEFIGKEDREALKSLWDDAKANHGTYDPASYLKEKGYTIKTTYDHVFTTAPTTLDLLATAQSENSYYIVQGVEGLVQYDNLGNLQPDLASSWEISPDGTVYTFHLRDNCYWYKADGTQYAKVTAQDFVTGFQHMLDASGTTALGKLVSGVVVGVTEYLAGETTDISDVGVEASDELTFKVTLERATPYFESMLTYANFMPMNKTFFLEQGGKLGTTAYKKAIASSSYTYGKAGKPDSILYNGAFRCTEISDGSKITFVQNDGYWDAKNVNFTAINLTYDPGNNVKSLYDMVIKGDIIGLSLTSSLFDRAKSDGVFEKAYVSSTGATSYLGSYNLNRQKYQSQGPVASSKKGDTAAQKNTRLAMVNKNFRKALTHAWDKSTMNAISKGEELKDLNLRNMYTSPDFVTLDADTTVDGHTFKSGTTYGEVCQYYVDTNYGGRWNVADGVNGYYNPDLAVRYLNAAVSELGDTVSYPIHIDIVTLNTSDTDVAQCKEYKENIEKVLGSDKVTVDIMEASQNTDYLACSYSVSYGADMNYDFSWSSGWGPDFGDPISYLNTYEPDGQGYMTKSLGMW